MSNIRAIRTKADYQTALARINKLMDAEFGTSDGDELDVLTDLVEIYEARHVPIGYPSPIEAIRFRIEQGGLAPRDLVPFLGSRAKVSEILSGKRPLTMQMARALHANLGIPAEVLLQQPGGELPSALEGIDWQRFPLAAMVKFEWIAKQPNLLSHAEEIMRDLIRRAGGEHILPAALYRKNDQPRANAKMDPYALSNSRRAIKPSNHLDIRIVFS
jgi:HTH-type transcriptional regulator/antitoxin HigA